MKPVLSVALAVLLTGLPLYATQQRPIGPPTRLIQLSELTDRAHYIFRGTVVEVGTGAPKQTPGLKLQKVSVRVTFDVKGNIPLGQDTVEFYQSPLFVSPLEKDQDVVLFLAPPNSETGLSAPLGFSSGHFAVTKWHHGLKVQNLRGNENLWGETLWSTASRERVLTELTTLKNPDPTSTLEIGDRRCPGIPIPWDLLVAVVRARLNP